MLIASWSRRERGTEAPVVSHVLVSLLKQNRGAGRTISLIKDFCNAGNQYFVVIVVCLFNILGLLSSPAC